MYFTTPEWILIILMCYSVFNFHIISLFPHVKVVTHNGTVYLYLIILMKVYILIITFSLYMSVSTPEKVWYSYVLPVHSKSKLHG